MPDALENSIETYLITRCRHNGFLCLKFVSPGRGGVPDRIIVSPGATIFVEAKRPGGKPSKRQRPTHAKLRRFGAIVYVIDDKAGVDRLMVEINEMAVGAARRAN